jgi:hypothetical protein
LPNGDAGKLGKVPVGLIQITSGNPESGTPVFIPPLPETTSANAPESITSAPAPSSAPAPAPAPAPTPAPPYEFRFYGAPFLKTLYTRVVGLLTAPPYEFTVYGVPVVKTWCALGAGLLTAMAVFGLWDFIASRFIPPRAINPKKWFFDQETNEYYRITATDREGLLFDRSTHRDRFTEFLLRRNDLKRARLLVLGTYAAITIFVYLMMDEAHIIHITEAPRLELSAYGWLFLFGFIALVAIGGFFGAFSSWLGGELWCLNAKDRHVGPVPVPPPSPGDILDHNTRKDARQPEIDDIERLLRDREGGGNGEPKYKLKA